MERIMSTALALCLKHSIQYRKCKVTKTEKNLILQNFFSVLHSLKLMLSSKNKVGDSKVHFSPSDLPL